MYSKQENQRLKQEFWTAFAEKYPRKWILYDTKIKDFSFKFFVDNTKAQVMIDMEPRNEEKRIAYFEKIKALKISLKKNLFPVWFSMKILRSKTARPSAGSGLKN